MSFDTRAGTRGARQPGPGGPIGRWLTKRAINRIRRKGKMPGLGFNALVLTTIGRKSGAERKTPVGWFPGKDGGWRGEESGVVPQHRRTSGQSPDRDGRPKGRRGRRAAARGGA